MFTARQRASPIAASFNPNRPFSPTKSLLRRLANLLFKEMRDAKRGLVRWIRRSIFIIPIIVTKKTRLSIDRLYNKFGVKLK